MKPTLIILLLQFLLGTWAYGQQTTVWASNLIDVSSQQNNSAEQVLGTPDAMVQQDQSLAWVPKKESNLRGEFIHVGFERPIRTRQIAIAEASHPGSIHKINLIFTDGNSELIYENKYPRTILTPNRLFTYSFPLTRQKVAEVKIELATKVVSGFNRIDAIAISDEIEAIKLATGKTTGRSGGLGPMVNSSGMDFQPFIAPDGKALYFVRRDHIHNMGDDDIWVSYLSADDSWTKAVNIGAPLNNRKANQVIGLTNDGRNMYLKMGRGPVDASTVFMAKKQGRSWARPQKVNLTSLGIPQIENLQISNDGKAMVLAVTTPNNGLDLQVSFLKSGQWTKPKSMGDQINSNKDEKSLFISNDLKTIYFSSNGHGGMGGQDMFMSRRLDDSWTNWSTPLNFGTEFNDEADNQQFSFTAEGEWAYFSARNENGDLDIFRLPMPEELLTDTRISAKNGVIDLRENKSTSETKATEKTTNDLTAQARGSMAIASTNSAGQLRLKADQVNNRLTALARAKSNLSQRQRKGVALPDHFQKDEELEELKSRYVEAQKSTKTIASKAPNQDDAQLGSGQTEDQDLLNMKKRFNQFNKKASTETEETEYLDMEISKGEVFDEAHDQETYGGGFENLQNNLWRSLADELEPQIRLNMKKQLFTQMEREFTRDLKDELDIDQAYRLKQEGVLLYREIKKNLRAKKTDKLELKGIPNTPVAQELRQKMEPLVRRELFAEMQASIAQELRNELEYRYLKGEEKVLQQQIKEAKINNRAPIRSAPAPVSDKIQSPRLVKSLFLQSQQGPVVVLPGQVYLFENITFKEYTTALTVMAESELLATVALLKEQTALMIEIAVTESVDYGMQTAYERAIARAQAIQRYLSQNGIALQRVIPKGYDNQNQQYQRLISEPKVSLKILSN